MAVKRGDSQTVHMQETALYESPVGNFLITSNTKQIIRISYTRKKNSSHVSDPVIFHCIKELDEYFAGKRDGFTVPVELGNITPFSMNVLRQLRSVPYGKTVTYGELAGLAGSSKAARAVGNIMHGNKIPIIYPCHRVIACGGKIGGFGMGIGVKKKLLQIEGVFL